MARRSGLAMTALALTGLVIATYLAITKLTGGAPVCGPIHGCDTVAASSYSEVLGIPVAVYGVGFSLVLVGLALAWWRLADGRALLGAYGLGLLGCLVVAGLTYLELFVIHAICVYCVAYAVTVVAGFVVAAATLRMRPDRA
ncbi:MAG: vitamin K epoxide reductase family protein [Chloroflexi bacterium]|nr:MAG: vitamin K epoxide reductase family protein [Chloroflexota bacterium]